MSMFTFTLVVFVIKLQQKLNFLNHWLDFYSKLSSTVFAHEQQERFSWMKSSVTTQKRDLKFLTSKTVESEYGT